MVFKDDNEHNKPKEGGENWGENTPESLKMKEFQKERKEALDTARKLESELAHQLETDEAHQENTEAEELMRQSDFPGVSPENPDSPEYAELRKMFEEIKTDHIEYPFFRRLFPNFIRVCESSRMGQSLSHDVLGLALGIAESLVSVVKLGGHLTLDTIKVVFNPRKSYQETTEIVS